MAYVPPFSALDFHSTVFSLVFKSPIEWDPEKRRVVFTPSRRATPIWTVIAIGCEICLLQVLCGYLLISEFWWPEKSTLSSSQVMFQVIIVLLSAVQGVIAYIFWIYWDDWKFAFGQFVWLLERLERRYAPYPQKPGSYSSIILIFKLADIFVTLAIFLFTPMAVVLNIDPFHHILTQLSPYYTAQVSLHVWIGATFRVPLCILMMLDVARVFIYIGIMFVIACKIWLRYFYLIEEPYRVHMLPRHTKLRDAIATYREVLVQLKVFHCPLTTLSTLMTFIISVSVIIANFLAVRMHQLLPAVVLYVIIPGFLVGALWLPYHILPDCGDFTTISEELIRKWRLRAGSNLDGWKKKRFEKVLRSLPVCYFKFGLGEYVFINISRATKGMYQKVIVDNTISALLFNW
ncbi:hypothetical protein Fcan01_17051 [Folsomia candida]|uniref:Uncharacterized protein n=1 Tax=Folsomia candida TaxID=158441 RepID=A0A226DRL5_FOLCA|nr:hypothetical protein Fcan01_17051 [Folsomia candida]